MADNVDITPGAGATVAADLVGGALHQRVKLSVGADGSAADAPGDATNGFKVQAVGATARDAAVSDYPILGGATARALAGTTPPTAVNADADKVDILASREGVQYVHPHGAYILSGTHGQTAEAHTDQEVIAAVAGLAFHITDVVFSTDTDATTLVIECDTAGAKTALIGKMYFKSGGGCALNFRTPIRAAVGKNVGFTTTISSTGSVTISGYYAP